jgi:hypothetical protein
LRRAMAMLGPYRESNRCSSSGYSLHMNTPDHYAGTAEQDISSAVTGAHDFAETIQSAGVYALLAVAAAIKRLADAVSEVGTPATYQPPERR